MDAQSKTPRRTFLGKLAGTTLGLPALLSGMPAQAEPTHLPTNEAVDADAWFNKIRGTHKIVYDASEPNQGYPIIWTWVFYKTNNQTGTKDSDMTAVVALRHKAIALALNDHVWAKYKLGEFFKITDNNTKAAAIRNPFYEPQGIDFPKTEMEGIKKLQERGAMFCVCEMALTNRSENVAKETGQRPEDVKAEWMAGIHPGIQVVPSGVWAIGRAQEKGCGYCYAGG